MPPGKRELLEPKAVFHTWEELARPAVESSVEQALNSALDSLDSSDWEVQFEGLTDLQRFAKFHADAMAANIDSILSRIGGPASNLRSGLARNGVVTIGRVAMAVEGSLTSCIDELIPLLVSKTANTAQKFLADAAMQSAETLCTGTRVNERTVDNLAKLSKTRSSTILKVVAQLMRASVEALAGQNRLTIDMMSTSIGPLSAMLDCSNAQAKTAARETLKRIYSHWQIKCEEERLTRDQAKARFKVAVQQRVPDARKNAIMKEYETVTQNQKSSLPRPGNARPGSASARLSTPTPSSSSSSSAVKAQADPSSSSSSSRTPHKKSSSLSEASMPSSARGAASPSARGAAASLSTGAQTARPSMSDDRVRIRPGIPTRPTAPSSSRQQAPVASGAAAAPRREHRSSADRQPHYDEDAHQSPPYSSTSSRPKTDGNLTANGLPPQVYPNHQTPPAAPEGGGGRRSRRASDLSVHGSPRHITNSQHSGAPLRTDGSSEPVSEMEPSSSSSSRYLRRRHSESRQGAQPADVTPTPSVPLSGPLTPQGYHGPPLYREQKRKTERVGSYAGSSSSLPRRQPEPTESEREALRRQLINLDVKKRADGSRPPEYYRRKPTSPRGSHPRRHHGFSPPDEADFREDDDDDDLKRPFTLLTEEDDDGPSDLLLKDLTTSVDPHHHRHQHERRQRNRDGSSILNDDADSDDDDDPKSISLMNKIRPSHHPPSSLIDHHAADGGRHRTADASRKLSRAGSIVSRMSGHTLHHSSTPVLLEPSCLFIDFDDLEPPEVAGSAGAAQLLGTLMDDLAAADDAEWRFQFEKLNAVQAVAKFHPTVIAPRYEELIGLLGALCNKPSSGLARNAALTIGRVASSVEGTLEHNLSKILPMLVHKAANPTQKALAETALEAAKILCTGPRVQEDTLHVLLKTAKENRCTTAAAISASLGLSALDEACKKKWFTRHLFQDLLSQSAEYLVDHRPQSRKNAETAAGRLIDIWFDHDWKGPDGVEERLMEAASAAIEDKAQLRAFRSLLIKRKGHKPKQTLEPPKLTPASLRKLQLPIRELTKKGPEPFTWTKEGGSELTWSAFDATLRPEMFDTVPPEAMWTVSAKPKGGPPSTVTKSRVPDVSTIAEEDNYDDEVPVFVNHDRKKRRGHQGYDGDGKMKDGDEDDNVGSDDDEDDEKRNDTSYSNQEQQNDKLDGRCKDKTPDGGDAKATRRKEPIGVATVPGGSNRSRVGSAASSSGGVMVGRSPPKETGRISTTASSRDARKPEFEGTSVSSPPANAEVEDEDDSEGDGILRRPYHAEGNQNSTRGTKQQVSSSTSPKATTAMLSQKGRKAATEGKSRSYSSDGFGGGAHGQCDDQDDNNDDDMPTFVTAEGRGRRHGQAKGRPIFDDHDEDDDDENGDGGVRTGIRQTSKRHHFEAHESQFSSKGHVERRLGRHSSATGRVAGLESASAVDVDGSAAPATTSSKTSAPSRGRGGGSAHFFGGSSPLGTLRRSTSSLDAAPGNSRAGSSTKEVSSNENMEPDSSLFGTSGGSGKLRSNRTLHRSVSMAEDSSSHIFATADHDEDGDDDDGGGSDIIESSLVTPVSSPGTEPLLKGGGRRQPELVDSPTSARRLTSDNEAAAGGGGRTLRRGFTSESDRSDISASRPQAPNAAAVRRRTESGGSAGGIVIKHTTNAGGAMGGGSNIRGQQPPHNQHRGSTTDIRISNTARAGGAYSSASFGARSGGAMTQEILLASSSSSSSSSSSAGQAPLPAEHLSFGAGGGRGGRSTGLSSSAFDRGSAALRSAKTTSLASPGVGRGPLTGASSLFASPAIHLGSGGGGSTSRLASSSGGGASYKAGRAGNAKSQLSVGGGSGRSGVVTPTSAPHTPPGGGSGSPSAGKGERGSEVIYGSACGGGSRVKTARGARGGGVFGKDGLQGSIGGGATERAVPATPGDSDSDGDYW